MAKDTQKGIQLQPITDGLVMDGTAYYTVAPKTSLSYMENTHSDNLGVLTTRRPLFRPQFTPSATAERVINFTTPSSSIQTVWKEGTSLRYIDASQIFGTPTVTTVAGAFGASVTPAFDYIQGRLIFNNGTASQPKLFNGSTVTTLTTSFPANAFDLLSAGYNGQIWQASTADTTCSVYYSDVIPTVGVASTTGGANFIRLNPNAGDSPTGLVRTEQALLVFTQNSIYRIYNTQSADNSPMANVGAVNQNCILRTKSGLFFLHQSGVYQMPLGGAPVEISREIYPFIQRVASSSLVNATGWVDDDHVYFSVGTKVNNYTPVSRGGTYTPDRTYVLRYTISSRQWTIYSFIDTLIVSASYQYFGSAPYSGNEYDQAPFNVISVTDLAGNNPLLCSFNSLWYDFANGQNYGDKGGVAVVGKPITIDSITQWIDLGEIYSLKTISGVTVPHEGAAGITVMYQVDNQRPNEWQTLGTLDERPVSPLSYFSKSLEFNRIRFRYSGTTTGEEIRIGQPVLMNPQIHGTNK